MIVYRLTIRTFVERYALERDLADSTIEQLQVAATLFERWAGGPIPLGALSDSLVNSWLASLKDSGRSAVTVQGKRRAILTLWRSAFEAGLADDPPRRVRKIRVDQVIVKAWTKPEADRLLRVATLVPGEHPGGMLWADWWAAFVCVGWDSGLRLGDLLSIRTEDIDETGLLLTVQSKTGWPKLSPLCPETLRTIARTYPPARELVFPWPHCRRYFYDVFRRLVESAGIPAGGSKWLRRSSATAIESANPGAARTHLGHKSGAMWLRYVDQTQLQRSSERPRPPRLG